MAQKISEIQHIAIKAIQNKADRKKKKTGNKNSVNELWDKFNLMTKFFYCITSQQQIQLNIYKRSTSKFSNGVRRPENNFLLKMLKLKSTTSVKNFNILKQNQYVKRQRKLLSNLLHMSDRVIRKPFMLNPGTAITQHFM